MGCLASTIVPQIDDTPCRFDQVFNELDMISFYSTNESMWLRMIFMDYLGKINMKRYFLLYETISNIQFSESSNISSSMYVELGILLNECMSDKMLNVSLIYSIQVSNQCIQYIRAIRKSKGISRSKQWQLQIIRQEIYVGFKEILISFYTSALFLNYLAIPSFYKNDSEDLTCAKYVLLATENVFFAKIMTRVLRMLHFRTIHVTSGQDTLKALLDPSLISTIKVVLVDNGFTDRDSISIMLDFLAKEDDLISNLPNYCRPKMLCLLPMESDQVRTAAIQCGYMDILNIPFQKSELEECLYRPVSRRLSHPGGGKPVRVVAEKRRDTLPSDFNFP